MCSVGEARGVVMPLRERRSVRGLGVEVQALRALSTVETVARGHALKAVLVRGILFQVNALKASSK